MSAIIWAGLTGWHLLILAFVVVSLFAAMTVATRKPKTNPQLAAAVDAHWETTPQGTRIWRGATFVPPAPSGDEAEGEPK